MNFTVKQNHYRSDETEDLKLMTYDLIHPLSKKIYPSGPPSYRLHEEYEGIDFSALQENEDHPLWKTERIELKSVGIDIGSSTSHLMFSRVVLRRLGVSLSSRFVVVERQLTWASPILLTPYKNSLMIDTDKLSRFIDDSYRQAGYTPKDIDTGAVIITGEALRKENAEAILDIFSSRAGDFVCATAGPNLEAILSAHGCGGVKASFASGIEKTVMVVDIGGGTTKLAIARRGVVRETAAVNVGARLVVTDDRNRLTRVEKAAKVIGGTLGIDVSLGAVLSDTSKEKISSLLADIIFKIIERKSLDPLAEKLMITAALGFEGPVDMIVFTGGVAEYIYGKENRHFGDLGFLLGEHICSRSKSDQFGIPIGDAKERIRATVLGASQYTIQVSGNTIFITNEKLLPLKNIQVISPRISSEEALYSGKISHAIGEAFRRFDFTEGIKPVALSLHWDGGPEYPKLRALAEGIQSAFKNSIQAGLPLILVFLNDFGALVGNILHRELGIASDIISIDLVHLHDFDFIDIGKKLKYVDAVPIVVKSLLLLTEREKDFLEEFHEGHSHGKRHGPHQSIH